MDSIHLRALGKINLGLDVVRKREDGYHEVRMIMQTVSLYDKLCITKKASPGIEIKTNLFYLPTNENNLIYKACKMLMEEFEITDGVEVKLRKFIPVAAGMAGGSSDAAAALFGMNKLFHLGLNMQKLMERGVKIGADVPYCLMRGTALSEGIGEKLTRLPAVPKCHVLIAKPNISVSTKFVYGNLHVNELKTHPDIDGIIEGIRQKNIYQIADKLDNVLETVTAKNYPIIEEIKTDMKAGGALNAIMSGSGPTVFGLFEEEEQAYQIRDKLKREKKIRQTYVTDFYNK